MKALLYLIRPNQGNTVGKLAISTLNPVTAGSIGRCVKMHHLMARMDCTIGAPCTANHEGTVGDIAQRALYFGLHRGAVFLFLKATKSTAVVGYDGSIAFGSLGKTLVFGNLTIWGIDTFRPVDRFYNTAFAFA